MVRPKPQDSRTVQGLEGPGGTWDLGPSVEGGLVTPGTRVWGVNAWSRRAGLCPSIPQASFPHRPGLASWGAVRQSHLTWGLWPPFPVAHTLPLH